MTWELAEARWDKTGAKDALLAEGWEPFAVDEWSLYCRRFVPPPVSAVAPGVPLCGFRYEFRPHMACTLPVGHEASEIAHRLEAQA